MKRLKKLFAFLIIVSMLITVLGGCGGETADDNQTDSVAQETAAAQLAIFEFTQSTLHSIYLLNRAYMPYYKWSFRGLKTLSVLGELAEELEDSPVFGVVQCKCEIIIILNS